MDERDIVMFEDELSTLINEIMQVRIALEDGIEIRFVPQSVKNRFECVAREMLEDELGRIRVRLYDLIDGNYYIRNGCPQPLDNVENCPC